MSTVGTATDSAPTTTELKVAVTQEPENPPTKPYMTASLVKIDMSMIGPYHFPDQYSFKESAPHLMADVHVVRIGIRLGIGPFFIRHYAAPADKIPCKT